MTTVSRSVPDLARQLQQLGVNPEALTSRHDAVHALKDTKGTKDIREVLSSFSKEEFKALRDALGQTGGSASGSFKPGRSGVGGAGVMRFQLEDKLPGKAQTHPDVVKLLSKYEPDRSPQVPRSFERLLQVVAFLENQMVQEKDPEKLAAALSEHDARRQVFLLEGQLRMYTDKFGKAAEKGLEVVKGLEDGLGAVSLWQSMRKIAEEKKAPAAVVANLAKKEAAARADLVELVKDQWMPDPDKRGQVPAFNKMIKRLSEENFGSYDKDRSYLCDQVASHLKKIEQETYDWNDLPNGIHEFRRDLRWLPVYVEATGGLMQLNDQDNPVPALQKMLQDPVASSKFVQLPAPDREPKPVELSKSIYAGIMKSVLDLGAIKDEGEKVEFLAQAYVEAGAAPSTEQAEHLVHQLLGAEAKTDIYAAARKIHDDLVGGGALKALRHALEDA